MFYFFALFFATDYEAKMRKIARESYFCMINHVLLFMARKLLRRKLTIPRKSDIPLACCAAPGGPCCVLLNLSIVLISYHLGIMYLHTRHVYIQIMYVCVSGRICIMKNVIRCGLPNYLSFLLFTYNDTIISFLLLLLSLFSFTCVHLFRFLSLVPRPTARWLLRKIL